MGANACLSYQGFMRVYLSCGSWHCFVGVGVAVAGWHFGCPASILAQHHNESRLIRPCLRRGAILKVTLLAAGFVIGAAYSTSMCFPSLPVGCKQRYDSRVGDMVWRWIVVGGVLSHTF